MRKIGMGLLLAGLLFLAACGPTENNNKSNNVGKSEPGATYTDTATSVPSDTPEPDVTLSKIAPPHTITPTSTSSTKPTLTAIHTSSPTLVTRALTLENFLEFERGVDIAVLIKALG